VLLDVKLSHEGKEGMRKYENEEASVEQGASIGIFKEDGGFKYEKLLF